MKLKFISFFYFLLIFIFSIILFMSSIYLLMNSKVYFLEWEIFSINSCMIIMSLLVDWMSLMFMSYVLFISSLVIYYSGEYMEMDMNINRFIYLVLLFVMSMMLLIISPNLLSILLGWDGLGLVSYCLVIYFQNMKSYSAGMLTALSNRIGDVAIILAIAWMMNYGGWSFIFYLEFMKNSYIMLIISMFIMLAAMTKSAQIPFSSWLPAAMAAPTPVSALVHSSTLVTAGVYLLIRFNILFTNSLLSTLLLLFSGLTMFMSGLGANFEFDLKKIIALSTLSQLGLMMMILSMGFYKLAFFHLLTHALFKALLFLCAGVIIHNLMNSQDIRGMGMLFFQMPLTSSCFNTSNLALCGMPFLAGFYSKDLILEMVSFSYINMFSFFLFFISTGLTVSYSFRLIYYSMIGECNSMSYHSMNDESWIMMKSMLGLISMVIIMGSMLNWLIFPTPLMILLPLYLKLLTLIVCIIGGFFGYCISFYSLKVFNKSLFFYFYSYFFSMMWFLPILSTMNLNYYCLSLGKMILLNMDQGWSEYLGAQNLYKNFMNMSMKIQLFQNNSMKIYLMSMFLWMVILFLFMLL
uniref:NADH dehydrogenase subunit 5 n=1 Tax=Penthetria simplicipes TaxID=3097416 RepID=UPI002E78B7A0|nr:NADH dehydrogenase subunit 5 [Penthetria simplicipes]WPM86382.1 NADH dehydrogenase subunit 5 [Penthetria simplicipes]